MVTKATAAKNGLPDLAAPHVTSQAGEKGLTTKMAR